MNNKHYSNVKYIPTKNVKSSVSIIHCQISMLLNDIFKQWVQRRCNRWLRNRMRKDKKVGVLMKNLRIGWIHVDFNNNSMSNRRDITILT